MKLPTYDDILARLISTVPEDYRSIVTIVVLRATAEELVKVYRAMDRSIAEFYNRQSKKGGG